MAGLYIHIPFCKSRCIYCGFYSTTLLKQRQHYVDAICKEIKMRGKASISTIYFGGGTPSLLNEKQLRNIFETIYIYNKVEKDAEVTIEANPDDITPQFATLISQLPINRVSLGIQTFDDKRLLFLKRRHNAQQAKEAVGQLRDAGIENLSIDLMYGFPQENLQDWEQDIESALSLHIDHLSAYCLMIEEGTPLYRMQIDQPNEELERSMYYLLTNRMKQAGFEHYEISNFSKPGYRSRHNSSYWTGIPYIGIGAAAHSFDINSRSWNVADINEYIEGIAQGVRRFDAEIIDDDTRYNDTITVALRTVEGIDLNSLTEKYRNYCLTNAKRYLENGLLTLETNRLRLTYNGLFVSDMVMSDLIKI